MGTLVGKMESLTGSSKNPFIGEQGTTTEVLSIDEDGDLPMIFFIIFNDY